MNYQNILVAIELTEESKQLIDRAVSMAKLTKANLSFVHIDGTHGEIYPELIDIQSDPKSRPLNEPSNNLLEMFREYADYPLHQFLIGTGDLGDKLENTINDNGFDLLICGHHHDFWSQIVSYSRHLINKSSIDILVIPIK
ncbi:universal stress protein [Vibrio makurazakiensis]|uniref:universal stress protein n=1 Tax=Vibrio makurazakiensis TaxID=2910250 RepID=UPI003D151D43